jgi:hypothetical protein
MLSCLMEGKIFYDSIYYSGSFDINRDKIRLPTQIHFLLCNTCYWCASDIGSKSKFTKCPSCNSLEVESMPIAKNELYKFDCYEV